MQLHIAEKAGFCFGVRRAIKMVEKALAGDEPVSSLGPVIHNPQVINRLKEEGLDSVSSLDDVTAGVVVIRSHGAPLSTYESIEKRGLGMTDATCPFVKKMHHQARSLMADGYQLIIVGDRNHSEITSLTDDPNFTGMVVSSVTELESENLSRKVGLISQTTQPIEHFCEIANYVLKRAVELKIFNTICDSTLTRQIEAREIAAKVQVMVVIGGRNSANTRRLVEICEESGARTIWVETAGEIDAADFTGVDHVGLTAGASTPEWIIQEVIERLESFVPSTQQNVSTLPSGRYIP